MTDTRRQSTLSLLLSAGRIDRSMYDRIRAEATEGRETVARWMIDHGYATGHGDTIDDLLSELESQWGAAPRAEGLEDRDLFDLQDESLLARCIPEDAVHPYSDWTRDSMARAILAAARRLSRPSDEVKPLTADRPATEPRPLMGFAHSLGVPEARLRQMLARFDAEIVWREAEAAQGAAPEPTEDYEADYQRHGPIPGIENPWKRRGRR